MPSLAAGRQADGARAGALRLALCPLLVVLLSTCQPRGSHERIPAPSSQRSAPEPEVAATEPDSLRLQLHVPDQVRAGDTVPMTLRVHNVAGRPLDLHLRGRTIAFDIVVTRADGSTAWRRLEGQIIPAIIQLRTLAADEALELRAEWHQRTNKGEPVGSGVYTVQALLLTDAPQPLESPRVPLQIVAR